MSTATLQVESPDEKTSGTLPDDVLHFWEDIHIPQLEEGAIHRGNRIIALESDTTAVNRLISTTKKAIIDLFAENRLDSLSQQGQAWTDVPSWCVSSFEWKTPNSPKNVGTHIALHHRMPYSFTNSSPTILDKPNMKRLWTRGVSHGFFTTSSLRLSDTVIYSTTGNFQQSERNLLVFQPGQAFTSAQTLMLGFPTLSIQLISPEIKDRIKGHEQLTQTICSLARKEAQAHGLALRAINLRPAWAYELNGEQNGIVIDVAVQATTEQRFAYWDAMGEHITQLAATLSPQEQRFLNDDIFFIVNRS